MKIFLKTGIGILALLSLIAPQSGFASKESPTEIEDSSSNKPVASVPDDVYWDGRFTTRGLSGQVNAIAMSGSSLYVGGNFATADNVVVNRIARWNGTNWSALGEGVGCGVSYCAPSVNAIAISGSNVFVGGMFTTAGGVSASSIAMWNGSSWSALGSGVDGTVYAIAVNGNDVYVGGYFTNAGGVDAHSIAKWNTLTNTWSGLGTGEGVFGGSYCSSCGGLMSVAAVAVSGSNVYVGGYFTSASWTDVNYIAKFDGTSWSPLGNGVSGGDPYYNTHVSALAVDGNNIYVGGNFTMAGNVSANNIAVWDGSNWSPLGSGLTTSYCGPNVVSAIVVNGGTLYAGGSFYSGIATWDGATWNGFGGGVSSDVACPVVNAIASGGSDLHVGGSFNHAGGNLANYIARWSGGSWFALGNSADNGVNGSVYAIAINGNDVYVGGCFSKVDSVPANNIAKWNAVTNTWSALGTGVYSCVNAIAVSGSNVYVGGSLYSAGGNPVNGIAKWNGSNWSALGNGLTIGGCPYCSAFVGGIAISASNVYVGGYFDMAGSSPANNVAKWDGSTWSSLGTGTNASVNAITVSGSNLYVGGYFSIAGGIPAMNVAKWNGSAWSTLGTSGVNSPFFWSSVNAIAANGNDVYVGGNFSSARAPQKTSAGTKSPSGVSASNIARWNAIANTWYTLDSGVDSWVRSIAVSGNNLYAAGYFISAGSIDAYYIARWDGTNWSALGSGLNDDVGNHYAYAVAASGGLVYAGGDFTVAGAKPSYHFARWFKPTNFIYLPLIKR